MKNFREIKKQEDSPKRDQLKHETQRWGGYGYGTGKPSSSLSIIAQRNAREGTSRSDASVSLLFQTSMEAELIPKMNFLDSET